MEKKYPIGYILLCLEVEFFVNLELLSSFRDTSSDLLLLLLPPPTHFPLSSFPLFHLFSLIPSRLIPFSTFSPPNASQPNLQPNWRDWK